jgi:hypothetical protein
MLELGPWGPDMTSIYTRDEVRLVGAIVRAAVLSAKLACLASSVEMRQMIGLSARRPIGQWSEKGCSCSSLPHLWRRIDSPRRSGGVAGEGSRRCLVLAQFPGLL